MKKWAKICFIAMLALVIPPLANLGVSYPATELSNKSHDANTYSKGDSIQVSESVSVVVNGKPYSTQSSYTSSPSEDFGELNTIVVKTNSNLIATLDKIFNSERLRFNGKTLVSYDPSEETLDGKLSPVVSGPFVVDTVGKKNPQLASVNNMTPMFSDNIATPELESQQFSAAKLGSDASYEKYSALLILVPIGGAVFLCSGDTKTVVRSKSVCSFVFIIILVASSVTTPMSISGNYIQKAFAEDDNSTQLNLSGFSNSTEPLNLSGFSNATQSVNLSGFSNATNFNLNGFSNSTEPLNLSGFSNATQISNSTQIPNATKSWTFGNDSSTTTVGEVDTQNTGNRSALSLQGNGYLTENLNSTRNLSHLTLSAWVKPDYNQGAPTFTIISAEKQFILSINNILPPTKLATFSVFDGIKWDAINSTVPISGNWTHIAATFNGSSMQLYVNGTLQSSLSLNNLLTIQVDGHIGTKSVGSITSNGNLVIGAYYDSLRDKSLNQFSGLISNVNLYESDFDSSQVEQLYEQQVSSFYPESSTVPNVSAMVRPSMNETATSYLITQSPQFQFQYISDGNFTKIAHHFRQSNMTQLNGWHDSNTTINVQVTGPDGTPFTTKSTFKEIREGKFNIQLSPAKAAKPGLYRLNLTMVKNGKTYTEQQQYQWGLVSLNTQKSIYKPGETANLTVVVLDNNGQSVCNANLSMKITDPSGISTTLSSGSGIVPELQCGLYDAQYTTNSAGNYTVHIVAQNPSGVAAFDTSFLAQNSYPFDIIRTADSKIDPIDNPNSFNVKLDLSSYTNATNVSIRESVPSSFNVTTDGTVQTVGDSKILTWNKDMYAGNKTSVQYSYSVPLQYPQLYALGPAQVTYGNGQNFTEARPWFVAVDPNEVSVNSGTSITSPLHFAITMPTNTTKTVGIVSVVVDSSNAISGISVTAGTDTACSSGTQTFTSVSDSQASSGNNQIGLWSITAPSASNANICVSWTGTATRVDAGFILVNGTTAAGTIRQANATSGTAASGNTKTSLPISGSTAADIIIDSIADLSRVKTAIAPTDNSPNTHAKLWTQSTTFTAMGGSKNATGSDTLTWGTLNSGDAWLASAVAIERPFTNATSSDTITVTDKASTSQTPKDVIIISDQPTVTTGTYHSVTVQDSIASQLSDKASTGILVSDTVSASDSASITASQSYHVTVQDSIASQLSDKASTGTLVSDTISVLDSTSESVGIFYPVTVTENLASQLSDKISTGTLVTDSIASNLSDSASAPSTKYASLNDSVVTSDTISKHDSFHLADSMSVSDVVKYTGLIKIEAQDQNNVLVPGATYTISPNPYGGSTPLVVSDGGANDSDGTNNGRSSISLVPFGTYNITMNGIPANYNVLGNSTSFTIGSTQISGTLVFRLVSASTPLSTLGPTVTTTQPSLNATTLDTWQSSYNAVKLNGSSSSAVDSQQSLPPILSAGINNPSAISTAVSNQATVQLQTSFSQTTNGSSIINAIGAPLYSMPQSPDLVAVVPSIVATNSSTSATISTPPLNTIVPGQKIIIPVGSSTIPSTGGIAQLQAQASPTAVSVGNASSDWFVMHVNSTIPTQMPSLPSGVTPSLYLKVTYPFEETGQGFNWGSPSNFASQPQITLQLPRNPSGLQVDSNGCLAANIYVFDSSSHTWTTSNITILSVSPESSSTCDVVVQVPHFSQFAVGGKTNTSSSSGNHGSSSGGGGGAVGAGPGGVGASSAGVGASSAEGAFGGILLPVLKIYQVSYNTCTNDTATIIAGTDSDQVPTVILRSSITGVVSAQLAKNQPFLSDNLNATVKKYVYTVAVSPQDKTFEVVALLAQDNNVDTVGETVNVTQCSGTMTFDQYGTPVQPTDLSAPQIFDTKFQVANGTKMPSDNSTGVYLDGQDLTVYSIINSPTPISQAGLRYAITGTDMSQYSSVSMSITPLQISSTTYIVSGTIPSGTMMSPGVSYWLDIQNQAGKTTDSGFYTVGVASDSQVKGSLELDARLSKAEGSLRHPSAYFTNNDTMPVYGAISLFVDGQQVFTSAPQMFGVGQTKVDLTWKMPIVGTATQYELQARANIYGTAFETQSLPVESYPGTVTENLSQLGPISSFSVGNNTIADAYIIHSSFEHQNGTSYRVIAPDGTCVIGNGCLVSGSTYTNKVGSVAVTVSGQSYQVRYSGADSPLERFSITSVDPITGQWKVEILAKDPSLQSKLSSSVLVQIKYQSHDSSVITLGSK